MSDACAVIEHAAQAACCEAEEETCWICLDGPKEDHPLVRPCSCPRTVHASCLAKWQLTSAGRNEETRCRFCNAVLPDWRPALTPTELKPAASVMSVRYRGVTHKITYTPGPDGLQHFLETLQSVGIKVASASQVTFLCRSPDTGEEMALKGLKAFDAAAYCASITAAKRVLKEAKRKQQPPAPAHRHSQQQQQQQQQQSDTVHQRDAGAPGPASEPSSPTAAGSAGAAAGGCERAVAHVHAEALHVVDAAHDDAAAAHEHPAQHALYAHDAGASSSHAWHQHHPAASAGGDAGGSAGGPVSIPPAAGDSTASAEHQQHGAEVAPSGRARRRSGSSSVRGWWQQLLSCVSRPALHASDGRL